MPFTQPSLVGVVLAAAAAMLVGYVWYHPKVFGNTWMKMTGKKMGEMGDSKTPYLFMLAGVLIMNYVLGSVIKTEADSLTSALITGAWLWLGLVLPTGLANSVFEGKNWNLFWLQQGHHLVAVLVMSGVLFKFA